MVPGSSRRSERGSSISLGENSTLSAHGSQALRIHWFGCDTPNSFGSLDGNNISSAGEHSGITNIMVLCFVPARGIIVSRLVAQLSEEHMGCALEDYDRTFAVHSRRFMGGQTFGRLQSTCTSVYRSSKCN